MRLSRIHLLLCCMLPIAACSTSAPGGGENDASSTPEVDSGIRADTNTDAGSPSNVDASSPQSDGGEELKLGSPASFAPDCNVSERYSEYSSGGFEDGFYAIKVTPPTYPFLAESLSYTLKSGMVIKPDTGETVSCMASTPHKIGFFKAPAGAPAASPGGLQVWDGKGFNTDRTEMLPTSVVIEQGEVVYALIQLVRGVSATCVRACASGATAGSSFRAPTIRAPFAWSSFSPAGNVMITVNGRPILR